MRASRSPVEETHLGWSAKAVCWTRAGKKQGEQGTRMEVRGLFTASTLPLPSPPQARPHYPCSHTLAHILTLASPS